MKNLLLTFLCIIAALSSRAQGTSFATADTMGMQVLKTGSLSSTITDRYYKINLPADGTIRIVRNFTNSSAFNGTIRTYLYTKSQQLVTNTDNYITTSAAVIDTFRIYGRAKDTFYVRMSNLNNITSGYTIMFDEIDTSFVNEINPNGTMAQAQLITAADTAKGHVCFFSDNGVIDTNDYYKAVMPADGTIKLYLSGTNYSGNTSWAPLIYVYDKSGNPLTTNDAVISASGGLRLRNEYYLPYQSAIKDTMYVYGRAADTVYFRVSNYYTGTIAYPAAYTLRYEVIHQSPLNEAGANDNFTQAQFITPADTIKGHITYYGNNTAIDTNDYYKALLSADGTIHLYVTGSNYNGYSATSWAPMISVYDRSGNLLTTVNRSGIAQTGSFRVDNEYYLNFLASNKDTLNVYGRAADTVYFKVSNYYTGTTAYPSAYTLRYELIDQSPLNEAGPNNTMAQAQLITPADTVKGHIAYYGNNTTIDTNDYYKAVLPADGTIKLYASGTNYNGYATTSWAPLVYVYDKAGNPLTTNDASISVTNGLRLRNEYYLNFRATIRDTMYVYGRAADTVYFKVANYYTGSTAYPSAYTLRYELIDQSPLNESGPDNTMAQAQLITTADTVKGHIAYFGNNTTIDTNDYYKTVLTADGTIKLIVSGTNYNGYSTTSWAPLIYVFDKSGNPLTTNDALISATNGLRIRNEYYLNFLATARDTMYVFGRAKDTVYFKVSNYYTGNTAYPSAYTLRYELVDQSVYNETEPNGTFAQATLIASGDTINGHTAYFGNNTAIDTNDYFKIVKPANGSIRLLIRGTNQNGYATTSWAPIVYAYDKNFNPLTVNSTVGFGTTSGMRIRNEYYLPFRSTISDTMTINCIPGDTIYLKIANYYTGNTAYPSSYSFRYDYLGVAKAAFDYSRTGNEFGFTNNSTNATNYQWSMGNSTNYTSFYPPIINYVPGHYDVRLIATSNVCNYRDTVIKSFDVAGIEYYTPKGAGSGGDVHLQVYGGALDTNTQVVFKKGSVTITPREKYTNTKLNHFTAVMDLHFATPGLYDVMITVPGQPAVTYPNGFKVDSFKYPLPWSQVVGPSRWLANVDNRFTLTVGNRGNVIASGVVVAMVWPKTVTVKWVNKDEPTRLAGIDSLAANNKIYTMPRSNYRFLDSLNTTTPIDSFEGKPFDGYIRYLLVRHIPGNATVDIPFTARAAAPNLQRFYTFTHRPNMLGSCPTENYEDMANTAGSELIDAADMVSDKTKIPLFQAFTKTAKIGQRHMASAASYAGREFWAWWDGYEIDHNASQADWIRETEANNEFALETAQQEIAGFLLNAGVARAGTLNDRINIYNKILANNPNLSPKSFDKAIDIINASGRGLGNINYDRLKLLKGLLDQTKNAATLSEKILKLQQLAIDCPELQQQIDDLMKLLGGELDHNGLNLLNTNSVNSFDPNDIYGPSGVNANRYVNSTQRQPFLITFENVDSASADAQIVRVIDTIDKTKFNINSLVLGDVVVGSQTIQVPKGRSDFMVQHTLDSIPGILVRIVATTDTARGIVTWQFMSIDSATNNRPLLHGFLPPNISKPQGTGSVAYTIEPYSTLTDGTALSSRATIIFDGNSPIATSAWSNTIDILPPTSNVLSATLQNDTVIQLKMNGTDNTSGIRKYNIYYQTNSGPWRLLGATFTDSLTMVGQHDSTYHFYSRAIDWVENMEVKTPVSEASITLPSGVNNVRLQGGSLSIFPNPADDNVTISFELIQAQEASITLYNVTGQKVSEIFAGKANGKMKMKANVSKLVPGMYSIQLVGAKGARLTQKLVVVH